jgi:hypothetical protein
VIRTEDCDSDVLINKPIHLAFAPALLISSNIPEKKPVAMTMKNDQILSGKGLLELEES